MVSPRGRCCSRGNHDNTALSGGKGSHDGGGRSICWRNGRGRSSCGRGSSGAAGRRRGGTVHPWLKSTSSEGLLHTKAGEGEKGNWLYKGRGGGGGGGGVGRGK